MKNMCLIIVVFAILFKLMFAFGATVYHVSDSSTLILITNVICVVFATFGLLTQFLSKSKIEA